MDAPLYIQVLEQTLLSFLERAYPVGHQFMADNDPKHTSKAAKDFLEEKGVSWWRTPAESPDCNPIKNLARAERKQSSRHQAYNKTTTDRWNKAILGN